MPRNCKKARPIRAGPQCAQLNIFITHQPCSCCFVAIHHLIRISSFFNTYSCLRIDNRIGYLIYKRFQCVRPAYSKKSTTVTIRIYIRHRFFCAVHPGDLPPIRLSPATKAPHHPMHNTPMFFLIYILSLPFHRSLLLLPFLLPFH